MREIKFRGKSAKTGSWVYGYFRIKNNDVFVIYHDDIETPIIVGTEGQFVGLTDKSGKEIYEGDVVISFELTDSESYVCKWASEFAMFEFYCNETETGLGGASYKNLEIIGNVHEHSHLLEGINNA